VGNTGLPQHGSQQFLVAATRFLSTCDVEQIRLAPDKCKYSRAPLGTAGLSAEQDFEYEHHRTMLQLWHCAGKLGITLWLWAAPSRQSPLSKMACKN
jgi:hypothetical protein